MLTICLASFIADGKDPGSVRHDSGDFNPRLEQNSSPRSSLKKAKGIVNRGEAPADRGYSPDGSDVPNATGLVQCGTGVALRCRVQTIFSGKLLLGGKPSNFSFDQTAKLRIELRSRMRVIVGNILDVWSNQFV